MTNNLKTVALLAFMSALVWWLGIALFGGSGEGRDRDTVEQGIERLKAYLVE